MKNILALIILLASVQFFAVAEEFDTEADLSTKCGTFRHIEQRRNPLTGQIIASDDGRPETTHSYISKSNLFKIHYDIAGVNAVDLTDLNQNGVPDYIDSVAYYFDYVYDIEVNQLGYHSPYPDDGSSGSEHYDVFVIELGLGINGWNFYGECVPENAKIPIEKATKYYSFIRIDNNFSELDKFENDDNKLQKTYTTNGIMGLKITAAHELHHAIQFGYGDNDNIFSIMEMVSVYMENRCFPESSDFTGYVRRTFKNQSTYPFGNGRADNGYGFGIYYHFISQKFGEETIRRQWELIEEGLQRYMALDSTLKEKGSSLKDSWNEFLAWIYNGTLSIDWKYFTKVKALPLLVFNQTVELTKDEYFEISGQLQPYEIRPIRYRVKKDNIFDTPDTLDFMFSNTDSYSIFTQTLELSDYSFSYPSNAFPSKPICDKYYSISSNKNINDTAFCRGGYQTVSAEKPYPSPFKLNYDDILHFPAPPNVLYGSKVLLQIFSIDNVELWSETKKIVLHNSKRVADVEFNTLNLGSGVYLYRISYADNSVFGKFAVVR